MQIDISIHTQQTYNRSGQPHIPVYDLYTVRIYKSVTGPYFWTVSDLLPHGLPTDKKLVLPMPRVYRFLFCYIPVTGWLQVVDFSLCQNSKFHCM